MTSVVNFLKSRYSSELRDILFNTCRKCTELFPKLFEYMPMLLQFFKHVSPSVYNVFDMALRRVLQFSHYRIVIVPILEACSLEGIAIECSTYLNRLVWVIGVSTKAALMHKLGGDDYLLGLLLHEYTHMPCDGIFIMGHYIHDQVCKYLRRSNVTTLMLHYAYCTEPSTFLNEVVKSSLYGKYKRPCTYFSFREAEWFFNPRNLSEYVTQCSTHGLVFKKDFTLPTSTREKLLQLLQT